MWPAKSQDVVRQYGNSHSRECNQQKETAARELLCQIRPKRVDRKVQRRETPVRYSRLVAADPEEVVTSNAGSQEGYLCQIGYCLVSPCMYGGADETSPRPCWRMRVQ